MIVRAWRIVKAQYVGNAFDGEGARRNGGRWNPPGEAVVYAAGARSLAMLEMMVQVPVMQLAHEYVCIPVDFDIKFMKSIDRHSLAPGWRTSPATTATTDIGKRWVGDSSSAVLAVPSVIVPEEFNYLLNPYHPDFARVHIGKPESLDIDARLLKNAR